MKPIHTTPCIITPDNRVENHAREILKRKKGGEMFSNGGEMIKTFPHQLIEVDPEIKTILQKLGDKGCQALIVGGAVRDAILNIKPKDIDIEVYKIGYDTLESFLSAYGKTDLVGKTFGIIKFKPFGGGMEYDFSIPRKENRLGIGHKGFEVSFDENMTMREAALRRDISFNALAYDPLTNTVYDYFGGIADLENKIIRHTSEKFREDYLRILRILQFQARFGFSVHPDTINEIREMLKSNPEEFDMLSKERIYDEFRKWAEKGVHHDLIFKFLRDTTLIDFYPILKKLKETEQDSIYHPEGDVEIHTTLCLKRMDEIILRDGIVGDEKIILIMAILLHDVGKPDTTETQMKRGRMTITSNGHEALGGQMSKPFLESLGFHETLITPICNLVTNHLAGVNISMIENEKGRIKAVKKLSRRLFPATIHQLLYVMDADSNGRGGLEYKEPTGAKELKEISAELNVTEKPYEHILMGRHLIEAGMKPSKKFGEILAIAGEAQENGEFGDLEGAKKWLAENMDKFNPLVTINNFHECTDAVFEMVCFGKDAEEKFQELVNANGMLYESEAPSRSKYVFCDPYIYRLSDHWGKLPNCNWKLKPDMPEWAYGEWSLALGKCLLSDFKRNENHVIVEKMGDGGDLENSEKGSNFIKQKITKDEIRNVISGKSKVRNGDAIQAAYIYLRGKEITSPSGEKSKSDLEEEKLIKFIADNNLWYTKKLDSSNYIDRGMEQSVYEDTDSPDFVLKTNNTIFYDFYWSKYFTSLLLHNYFFPDTSYELIGFKRSDSGSLMSVVKQHFIEANKTTNLKDVEKFLLGMGFLRKHPLFNMYESKELGIILSDFHDGNVLTKDDVLYFIDGTFYIDMDDANQIYSDGRKITDVNFNNDSLTLLAPNDKRSNLTYQQYELVRTREFKAWFGDWEHNPKESSKVVDENGEPLILYHYDRRPSGDRFNVFKTNKELGSHFGTKRQIELMYKTKGVDPFTSKEKEYEVFLNIKNPVRTIDTGYFTGSVLADGLLKKYPHLEEETNEVHDIESDIYRGDKSGKSNTQVAEGLAKQIAKKNSVDGIIYLNRFESNLDELISDDQMDELSDGEIKKLAPFVEDSYIIFSPNQVKLADGSNKTFDSGSQDIRFEDGGELNTTKKITKDEIQHVISGKVKVKHGDIIQATALYLGEIKSTNASPEDPKQIKGQEANSLKRYAISNNLWLPKTDYETPAGGGSEQDVYFFDVKTVVKTNYGIYYNSWLDYLNSLLLHNLFFPDTAYELIGFTEREGFLMSVVKQQLVESTGKTNLEDVKKFLHDNGFEYTKRNDYYSPELGIILEDLHDENVLTEKGILQFIDTVFYLKEKKEIGGLLHGSTNSFDKFKKSEIGAGSGEQQYGFGIYFTDTKSIAKYYANLDLEKNINELVQEFPEYKYTVAGYLSGARYDIETAIAEINKSTAAVKEKKDLIRILKEIEKNVLGKRYLYEVTLNKGESYNEYDYMDWDNLLTESQRNKIITKIKSLSQNESTKRLESGLKAPDFARSDTGEKIYQYITDSFEKGIAGQKDASIFLLKCGIDGIIFHYVNDENINTTNYVVFDEKNISIENKIKFDGGGKISESELEMGKEVEKEHTDTIEKIYDHEITKEQAPEFIALDHLKELPDYYTRLAKMEGEGMAKGGEIKTDDFPIRIDQLNKYIHTKYPDLTIYRHSGEASLYWASDTNDELALSLSTLPSTTANASLKVQTFGEWMKEADEIMDQVRRLNRGEDIESPFAPEDKNEFGNGGSVLLAPNGKQSNLTPPQYKLVRTDEFKKWFGGSKVVDVNGNPLVVYHGTNEDITEFDTSEKAAWFTPDIKEAKWYSNERIKRENGKIITVFLRLINPLDLYDSGYDNALSDISISELEKISGIEIPSDKRGDPNHKMPMWILLEHKIFLEEVKKNGYDGLIVKEDGYKHYAVFDSSQIKLSDGTNTAFDSNNSDIRFADGGEAGKELDQQTYKKWKSLVNMSKSELEIFYNSKEGKEAGLSASEAKKEGIDSGRESARWIMKMKGTPVSEWTPTMWKWAKKQINFISRMSGNKGGLYDDNGNKTRKHTSLLIWGNNPEKNIREYGGVAGNFLLAPNGKPSNLTQKQYKLVRTDEFKKWFGDWQNYPKNSSKVVDENGEPLVVYHGTQEEFNVFDKGKIGTRTFFPTSTLGFYFTGSKRKAQGLYANFDKHNKKNVLKSVFLCIKNPFHTTSKEFYKNDTKGKVNSLKSTIKENDGIIVDSKRLSGFSDEYVVFDPTQIKLADGSNKNFDPSNSDIRFAGGGDIENKKIKILYLHGLDATPESDHVKILVSDDVDIMAPHFNYRNKPLFDLISDLIRLEEPDGIIGHSMGGYLAYYLSNKHEIPALMFNPAFIAKDFHLQPIPDDVKEIIPYHNQIAVIGEEDEDVPEKKQLNFLEKSEARIFIEDIDHTIPDDIKKKYFDLFVKSISEKEELGNGGEMESVNLKTPCIIIPENRIENHMREVIKNKMNAGGSVSGNSDTKKLLQHLYKEHHDAFAISKDLDTTTEKTAQANSERVIELWEKELDHHFSEEEGNIFPELLSTKPELKSEIQHLINTHNEFRNVLLPDVKEKRDMESVLKFSHALEQHIIDEEKVFKTLLLDPYNAITENNGLCPVAVHFKDKTPEIFVDPSLSVNDVKNLLKNKFPNEDYIHFIYKGITHGSVPNVGSRIPQMKIRYKEGKPTCKLSLLRNGKLVIAMDKRSHYLAWLEGTNWEADGFGNSFKID